MPRQQALYVEDMAQTKPTEPASRCRLILTMGDHALTHCDPDALALIVGRGDVASIIFYRKSMEEAAFQSRVEPLIQVAQKNHIAAIVADDSRTAGRVGADGLQLGQDAETLREALAKFSPRMMVGAGNVKTRHTALVLGEMQPDYVMFGKLGGDFRPEPHPKNLDLGHWWSAMVEIPCIVLGGNAVRSVVNVARSGAEFVALGDAIFSPDVTQKMAEFAADRVEEANKLLDDHAPVFENSDE